MGYEASGIIKFLEGYFGPGSFLNRKWSGFDRKFHFSLINKGKLPLIKSKSS